MMKNMNCAYADSIDREHTSLVASLYRRIPEPLTDLDILELSETFLCNGTHYLKVNDLEHGRKLIQAFLSSLQYYHSIGCLTLFSMPKEVEAVDVFQELAHGGYIDKPDTMSDYFFDQFDHDFLWVELTASLSSLHWYQVFSKQLKASTVTQSMPVVKLLYEA